MKIHVTETEGGQAVMNDRPNNATYEGLRLCLQWLDACRSLGWDESVMPEFEKLFWKYRDNEGNRKL